jgi:hypothetical protein
MAKPLTPSQKAALAKEKARQAAAAAKKNKPKPTPSAGRRVNPKADKPKPAAAKPVRPALPPGRQGGPLATRPGTRPALPPGRPGGSLAIRPGGRGGAGAILTTAGMAGADVVGTAAGNAIGKFLYNQTKQSRNDPRRNTPGGRSTNPKAAKPKPKLADIRGTSTSKFADLRGSSKPGGSAPAAARELPKPTPKPTVTKAAAPSPRKVAPTPAKPKPKAPAKAKPPAASKPTVAQTSGIGPVKSGDEYARKKGSLREQARKLREMQAESRKRQGK